MGCTLSFGKVETTTSRARRGITTTEADGHVKRGNNAADTGALSSASTGKPATYVDYRGFQTSMMNATSAKVNTICRWLDSALEKRDKKGRWCIDLSIDGPTSPRSEDSICNVSVGNSTLQVSTSAQFRPQLSGCNQGEAQSLLGKSTLSRLSERSDSRLQRDVPKGVADSNDETAKGGTEDVSKENVQDAHVGAVEVSGISEEKSGEESGAVTALPVGSVENEVLQQEPRESL
ncbi:hypothetical protein ERJ75_001742200 [Trypanosoma vivax]|nr:hypothetical protein TRVL_01949 [Trypanosoma vivax]KAH8604104.1 hypothetical protein ERJ75_001742200 [Trypanosoma vivax]